MVQDDASMLDTELSSIHSNDTLISNEVEDTVSYPYMVIYQDHQVWIDSKNIKISNKLKIQYIILSACFLIFGLSDSTVGTVIPSLIKDYGIDHSQASYLFSSQFLGYLMSSLTSNFIMTRYGFYGTMIICQLSSALCFAIVFMRPPYAMVVLCYILNGFGAGILDSAGNLWIGKLEYCNQLLGLLHADYGLGGMISPVLITKMINSGVSWHYYYLILTMLCLTALLFIAIFFKDESQWKYKYLQSLNAVDGEGEVNLKEVISNKLVWFFSIVLFIYVGGELTIGNWMYNYILIVKERSTTTSSYITSTYWLFMTLGRVILGFVIGHWFVTRELNAVMICCTIISTCSLIFTIAYNSLPVQVIAVSILGFFVGPMFPTIVVVAMKYLPARLETAGVGMLVAMGGGGAAVIPSLVGVVSSTRPNGKGLVWFPFIIFVLFAIDAICFVLFYLKKRGEH